MIEPGLVSTILPVHDRPGMLGFALIGEDEDKLQMRWRPNLPGR